MATKDIANLIPTIQAVGLAGHNISKTKKKMSAKDILSLGVTNIVGVSMIKGTADITAGL